MQRKELMQLECPARWPLTGHVHTCIGVRCVAFEYIDPEHSWFVPDTPNRNEMWRACWQNTPSDPLQGGWGSYEQADVPKPSEPSVFWVDSLKDQSKGWWMRKNSNRHCRCTNYFPDRYMPE